MAKAGADLPRGILLYGRPGTGKTLTARYMSNEIGQDVPFYEFGSDEFDAAGIRSLFRRLSERGRAVIYIDEIDTFALHRSSDRHTENSRRTLAAMLTGLDGLVGAPGILVICSSNTHPNQLDSALMRAGRIGFVITFKEPETEEREELFRFFASTRTSEDSVDWNRAARKTAGKTPADLRQMLDDAIGLALLDDRTSMTEADVFAAIARDGIVEADVEVDPAFWLRTAVHEAGHVAALCALRGAARVYSVKMDKSGGATADGWDKPLISHRTNVSILEQIIICYAGSRAEKMIYGDFALGSHSDHVRASGVISTLIGSGLAEGLNLLAPPEFKSNELISEDLKVRSIVIAEEQAKKAQTQADEIVIANRSSIESFAAMLVEQRELSGSPLQEAIVACGFQAAESPSK
jgi:cell division protease FtsH